MIVFSPKYSFYARKSINQHNSNGLLASGKPSAIELREYTTNSSILLIYVFANTHKYAHGNLKYFIETAVREQDGIDYVFILQKMGGLEINESVLPRIPKSNAVYIQHDNQCFDFGTYGWFFEQYGISHLWKQRTVTQTKTNKHSSKPRKFNIDQYKYFIFMNSSTRGPFFPPYFLHFLSHSQMSRWYHIFTNRINDRVKLVGCTINCEDNKPHVQSYFLTTDMVGLTLLFQSGDIKAIPRGGVFGCYASKLDTIWVSEIPTSTKILNSGYLIDCLLTKYQSVDFSKKANFNCPIHANPYGDRKMDGTSLEPYEVVFVKYSDNQYAYESQERAKIYEKWIEDTKKTNRTSW